MMGKKGTLSAAGSEAEVWETLTSALGLKGKQVGQQIVAPAGTPAFSGCAEYLNLNPNDALLLLNKPAPGFGTVGTFELGGQTMPALGCYNCGDDGAETVARGTPMWQALFQSQFPATAHAGQSA
jgi:hypothetical protein